MNVEQYFNMENDGNRYELVSGELRLMSPSPTADHQRILVNLSKIFHSADCLDEGEFLFAPIDVVLGEEVRQPDFLFVRYDNKLCTIQRYVEGPPDLIAEILSPATSKIDQVDKFRLYEASGVNEYWLISPEYRSLERYVLDAGQYRLEQKAFEDDTVDSQLIRCIRFKASGLFRGLRPSG